MFIDDNLRPGDPGQLWYRFGAQRALRDAHEALDEAGVLLTPLIADTEWSSDGVRSLHAELETFRAQVGGFAAQLRAREWELEAAG